LLNLGGIVPNDFTLSDKNIREVQARLPNRNGMTTDHALWPGNEFGGTRKPDTHNVACMKNCVPEPKVQSFLPESVRDAHGNLAEQNRLVGAQHGVDTTRPEGKLGERPDAMPAPAKATPAEMPVAQAGTVAPDAKAAMVLMQKYSCTACHAVDNKIVGPSFKEIAKKYPGQADYLSGKIKSGGSGVWGPIPMPAQSLSEAEAKTIAVWLAAGAGK
jgi:cytochrome c551/c552